MNHMTNWISGVDLSTLAEVEQCGGTFRDRGREADAMTLLHDRGANLVRLRLWNDPYSPQGEPYGAGTCDLNCVLSLALRAKALGMDWMLDIHYSDFWADPGKQRLPKAWVGLDEDGLVEAVYAYTAQVLSALRDRGATPQYVAVGNELTYGLLWPLGRSPRYGTIARLLSAGIRAVREQAPDALVMLHLDNGGNNELYRTWFDHYQQEGGADFDLIGLSYYPFWHGTMEMLRNNLHDLADRFGKPMVVAETSTGFTLEDYAQYEHLSPENRKGMAATRKLAEHIDYPMTPEGQRDYLRDIVDTVRQTPHGLGRGFIYWEPAWIPVPGSQWGNDCVFSYIQEPGPGGNEWANQALFDYEGNGLPALEMLGR